MDRKGLTYFSLSRTPNKFKNISLFPEKKRLETSFLRCYNDVGPSPTKDLRGIIAMSDPVRQWTAKGLGCTTVLSPDAAAQFAAQIFGLNNHLVWVKLRASMLNTWISLKLADKKLQECTL
ncbi:UNVERIFIED_CONTAM: hypothetical protein FKN15_065098 [Acipenser sinensis]